MIKGGPKFITLIYNFNSMVFFYKTVKMITTKINMINYCFVNRNKITSNPVNIPVHVIAFESNRPF